MRKRTLLLVVAIAAAGFFSCNPYPQPQTPTVVEVCGGSGSCGGSGGGPTASPSVSPSPGCQSVAAVTVGFSGAGGRTSTRVGVGEVLDVTPRAGDRSEVPASCHGATVQWSLAGSAICELSGDVTGFNPHVTCSGPGSFTATATVAPPGGTGAAVFTVSP